MRNVSLRRSALLAAGIATSFLFLPTLARANPADGNVVAGQATITTGVDTVNINQSSDRAVIDWRSFDIAPNETTNFKQPTSSSIALNRVTNGQASQIEGTLTANGNIILVNPNGVVIRSGARIDVAGLVATTADIDNDKFMSGSTVFDKAGNPDASIVNAGAITAKDAGLVGLVAPNVENSGVITARLGRVQLASGETFTADFYGDGLLEVSVGRGLNSQLVKNTGTISAAGGTIALTAAAGSQIVNGLITVAGELDAPTVAEKSGKIVIYAEGTNAVPGNVASEKGTRSGSSSVTVAGIVQATGDDVGESGGNISVLADHVKVLSTAGLDASGKVGGGKILIGGAAHGEGATPTAIDATVQKGAAIRANAETSGNAGSVVVWSDKATNFAGAIEARALGSSGNGGFVETSGHTLEATGSVLADAAHGTAGTWLLDPTDITITTTTSNGTFNGGTGTFTPSASSSNVSAAAINAALNAGTSVTISTTSAYSGSGDITVSSALSKTAGSDATLTLQANRNIIVNAAISSTVGALNVVLDANSAGSGAGYVNVASTGSITTNGGSITIGGGTNPLTTAAVGTSSQTTGVLINAALSSGGGAISVRGTGYGGTGNSNYGINQGAQITSGGGAITLSGTGGGTGNTERGYYNGGFAVNAAGGNISITGSAATGGTGSFDDGVYLTGSGAALSTTGGGTINIQGNATGSGTGGSTYGVLFGAGATATAADGDIIVVAANASSGTGSNNHGLVVTGTGSGIKTTGAGAINVTGTGGGSSGNSNYGVVSYSTNGITTSGSGNVNVTGIGGGSTGGTSQYGVATNVASGFSATGTGNITLSGTAGGAAGTGSNNYGFYLNLAASSVTAAGGNISITGIGGNSGGGLASGVVILGTISTSGAGTITLNGTGGTNVSAAGNTGIYLDSSAVITTTGSGAITLTGVGNPYAGAMITSNSTGIAAVAGSQISSTGGSNIGLTGTGGKGNAVDGLDLFGSLSTTGAGAITLSGTSQSSNGASEGIYLPGTVTAVNGTIKLTGQNNASSAAGGSTGIEIDGTGAYVKTTGTGSITLIGTGGGTGAGTDNYGVTWTSSGNLSATGSGSISITGTGGDNNGTGGNNYGVAVAAALSVAGTGNLIVNGTGGGAGGSGANNFGIYQNAAMSVAGSSASITMNGTGNGSGLNNIGYRNAGANLTAAGGAISITGSGSITGADYSEDGVSFGGGTVSTTGSGTITLNGTAYGSGASASSGVWIDSAVITSVNGLISITGVNNSAGTAGLNYGIYISGTGGTVKSTGTGGITLSGTAGGGGAGGTAYGVFIGVANGVQATLAGGNSPITITGIGGDAGGSGASNYGIYSTVALAGNGGLISLTGTGGASSGNGNFGVYYTAAITNTGTGGITINGTGGGAGTSANNYGVNVAAVTTATGPINITGTGGSSSGGGDVGVWQDSAITSSGGNITVSGTGAGSGDGGHGYYNTGANLTAGGGNLSLTGIGAASGGNNDGVYINGTGTIGSTGSGTVTVSGTARGTAGTSIGVAVTGGGLINGTDGLVKVTGTNLSTGSGDSNFGVSILGSTSAIRSIGLGGVTVIGTGGGTGNSNYGVNIATANGVIASGAGGINITGTGGGNASSTNSVGIYVAAGANIQASYAAGNNIAVTGTGAAGGSGSDGISNLGTISAVGIGTVALVGTAGGTSTSSYGIRNASSISAINGALGLAGTGVTNGAFGISNTGTVSSTGSSAITLTAQRAGTSAVALSSSGLIGGASATGNIVIIADNVALTTAGARTTGAITIRPFTAGTSVGTGSGAGTLSISDAELALLNWGTAKTLTIGGATAAAITINSSYTFTKPVLFQNASGSDVTVTGTLSSTAAGNAVVIESGRNFTGGNISVTGGGRWLIYSVAPTRNTESNLTGTVTRVYGQTASTYAPASVTETGNVLIYVALNAGTITITADAKTRTYGAANPTLTYSFSCSTSCTQSNALATSPSLSTTATTASDVGNYGITVSGATLTDAYALYTITYVSGSLGVTPASLSVIGASAADKVYDGTTAATLSGGTLSGVLNGDTITLNASGSFADKNVGVGKTVTAAYTISGTKATNYTLTQPTGLSASITAMTITVTGVSAVDKVYDATTAAALAGTAALSGVVAGDTVTLGGSGAGTFADKNVGANKTVIASGYTISGADSGNYVVTQPTGLTASITAKTITVTGVSVVDKVYDATTAAALAGTAALSGVVAGDTVTLGGSGAGTFADKNVGANRTVIASGYTISGADSGNYVVTQPTGLTASITAKTITVTGVSVVDKVYDATTAAALAGTAALSGVITGDVVALGGSGAGTFADKNVGTGKAVTVTGYTISGTDSGNYVVAQPTGLSASITAKTITVTGVSAVDKVYDATTAAALAGTAALSGVVAGDTVTLGGTGIGAFADKNVGANKTVTASGYTISGTDSGNYVVTQPMGLIASITAKTITVTGVSAVDKIYDATTAATLAGTATLSGVVVGDTVTLGGTGIGAFADKNVGTGKAVTITGYTISGTDSGNYVVTQPAGLSASITTRTITVTSVSAVDKVYDATTTATLSGGTLSGVISGDVVALNAGTGSFADKNVGVDKPVTAAGYTISGADSGNYVVIQPTDLSASISARPVTIIDVSASDKIYDATATATLSGGTLSGLLSGDAVTLVAGMGTFADKNVGTDKVVTVTGYTISGADSGNYVVTQPTGLSASITAKTITVTGVSAVDKVYDATTTATLAGTAALSGVITGDMVALGGSGAGTFADKNVGTGKNVTVTGYMISGTDAGNYALSQPVGLTANITAMTITVTGVSAVDKVYDATTAATLAGTAALSGVVAGDTVTLGGSGIGAFADKNVGTGKAVTVTGYTISGTDSGNYVVTQPTGLSASITAMTITVTGVSAVDKVYDATTAATLAGTATLSGVVVGDTVTLGGTGIGAFADKNVGTGKAVTVTGYTISGTDSGNYVVTQPTGLSASITAMTITVTGVSAVDKVYDATTAATLAGTATLSGVVVGDTVTLGGTGIGAFADKNVGTGKAVTVTGYTISGTDSGNYVVTQPTGLSASITAKVLTVALTGSVDKVYDGNATATLAAGNYDLGGVIAGDVVTVSGNGLYDDGNAGTGKTVTVSGLSLSGASAGNYLLGQSDVSGTIGTITAKPVTVSLTGSVSKVYDAVTTATLSAGNYAIVGLAAGDTVNVSGTGTYDTKDAGTDKTVTASSLSLSGGDAANYTLATTDASAAIGTITPATLTVAANNLGKAYGQPDPALTYTYAGLQGSDTSGIFSGTLIRAAGENKGTYAITQGTLSAGSNYTLVFTPGTFTISNAVLTIIANPRSKTYGSADPTLTYTYSGFEGGDGASLITGALSRASGENAGTYAINQGSLSAGPNYAISFVSNTLTINPAPLAVSAKNVSKIYGSVDPTLTYSYSGLKNGDTASIFSGTLTRDAGSNVGAYTIRQGTLSAGGNYTVTFTTATLTINKASLTVTATNQTKVYGDADPALAYTYSGLKNGDTTSIFSGSLVRVAGEDVTSGPYAINQGTLSAGGNYTIAFVPGKLTITPAPLTIYQKPQSKVYGSSDPALRTLAYSPSQLRNGDTIYDAILAYSSTRASGENVGTYLINGTVTTNGNYTATVIPQYFTITPATLNVVAKNASKVYGQTDPALTYTYTGLQFSDTGSVISGTLARSSGENKGSYTINQGTLSAGSNYVIAFTSGTFTINAALLTIKAKPQIKTYGDADPALTFTYSGLVAGDNPSVITGTLARTAGANAGVYAIGQGTLSAGPNYTISYTGSTLTIKPAALSVTADDLSKIYGAADPVLTYTASGFKNGDTASVLSGSLARASGEAVAGGPYAISQGTLSAGGNYTITFSPGTLTVTPKALNVTADAMGKTYGDADPVLTYTYSGLVSGDTGTVFSGSLGRAAGESTGTYAINQGTLAAGSNYTIVFQGNNFSISTGTLVVNANPVSKIYGDADPALTFTYSGLAPGDTAAVFSGSLVRDAGENAGFYTIDQGTLSAGPNYTIEYHGTNFTVLPKTLTVTADNLGKVYGDVDPTLTYTNSPLANGDTDSVFAGDLARDPGTNVGTYTVERGTLSAGGNYTVVYVPGTFSITPAQLAVSADDKSKIYGDADPALTYSYTGLKNGDTADVFSGSLARSPGETVDGGPYAIAQGTLDAGRNYAIVYTGGALTITPAALTVTADNSSKIYGDADPTFTYVVDGWKNGDTASILTGNLSRAAGETVAGGPYIIGRGTLDAGPNYDVQYVAGSLTITPATLSVSADDVSKTYGSADPAFTYAVDGFRNGDTSSILSGGLGRVAGENVGSYAIGQGTLDAGANYRISFTNGTLSIDPAVLTVTADDLSKVYGDADPTLTYGVSGLQNDDTASILSGDLTRDAGQNVGTYAIRDNGLSAGPNYVIAYVAGELSITPALLTVTADNGNKTYGDADPRLTYSATGLRNGDTQDVFGGSLMRTQGENVGSYTIGQGSLSAGGNYQIVFIAGTFAIAPAQLSVSADSQTKIYGDPDPTLDYTYSGLKNGDTSSVFSGSLSRVAGENAGTYAILQGGLAAGPNYTIVYTQGMLTIGKAVLTVVADNESKVYGTADPALTYTYGGLKNGDTSAVFSGLLTRAPGESVAGGPYVIARSTLDAGPNYTIAYTPGLMTVTPAMLTVSGLSVSDKIYDGTTAASLSATGATLNGVLLSDDVTLVFISGSFADQNVGTDKSVIADGYELSGADAGNYSLTLPTDLVASITPAPLLIQANDATKLQGAINPVLTATFVGLVPGDDPSVVTGLALTTTTTTSSPAGSYIITPLGGSAANYAITYSDGTLTVIDEKHTIPDLVAGFANDKDWLFERNQSYRRVLPMRDLFIAARAKRSRDKTIHLVEVGDALKARIGLPPSLLEWRQAPTHPSLDRADW